MAISTDDGATWSEPFLLNRDGKRFCDECVWPDREIAIASQPNKVCYLLLDGQLVRQYSRWPHFISTAPHIAYAYVSDYEKLRPDITVRATTLAQVATARGLPATAVEATVVEYNRNAVRPLEGGPWVLLGPAKAYFTTTEGSAAVNEELCVLDERSHIIPGLYAVGQNGLGGQILWGHGLHIGWAITSGRLIGNFLARQ